MKSKKRARFVGARHSKNHYSQNTLLTLILFCLFSKKANWEHLQMTLLRTLLLATALALPITATQAIMADTTAEAAAKKGKKVVKAKKAKKAKVAAYKHCGAYKYWKAGKCNDARAKKG